MSVRGSTTHVLLLLLLPVPVPVPVCKHPMGSTHVCTEVVCFLCPKTHHSFHSHAPPVVPCAHPCWWLQDIFSLGCVIAELWLGEGRAFFDLGTLLAYRRGEADPAKELGPVEPDIAELVMHMIQREPGGGVGGVVEGV